MKRSRRSLGLLLASMAFSLLVLRATSLPTRRATSPHRKIALSLPAAGAPRAATSQPAAAPTALLARQRARTASPEKAVFTSRAVSMAAFIIALPQTPIEEATPRRVDEMEFFNSARRTGWSGCMAYANGCDHLGRTWPARQPVPSAHGRLFFGALKQVVEQALQAASVSAEVLRLAESASERSPSLASEPARSKAER